LRHRNDLRPRNARITAAVPLRDGGVSAGHKFDHGRHIHA